MSDRSLEGATVLVTGGAGFIGSHIADALVDRAEVRVLDDLSTGKADYVPETAELIVGDVCETTTLVEAMSGVDVVFHEAAVVSVDDSIARPLETDSINVDGTLQVLEAARREGARVVFASSAAVYGHPDSIPVPESDRTAPESPYGVSKLAADQYVRLFADLYDVPTVALRYFNVYGPRQSGEYAGVVTAFVEQARSGGPITVHGDGKQTRDFVHVDDVVRANLRAATTDEVGEAFNVGTGSSVTIRELGEKVRSLVDPDVDIVHTAPRDGDIDESRADTEKSRSRLGFDSKVELSEGLSTVPGATN
ncbi:NAD-dependent epimerase/dehydratase family protein [Halanaeroarchaeum sp. HSR-CO]|uniref:NAD-dependent epimerase/dehydratase family protein n=1 Tax=Halanaeroarchaeum sp. HSR-CO TaxID=2866382 RepID=UPI00217EC651|nr:NAD-dependent epimerase/dehydratase family protein [Halanaeroarchaeum sp. HSR-CO]